MKHRLSNRLSLPRADDLLTSEDQAAVSLGVAAGPKPVESLHLGVPVNAATPGMVRTPMNEAMFKPPENAKRILGPERASSAGMVSRVEAALPSLSPAEQLVGTFLIRDPNTFATLSAAELASLTGVSKPTVVRFCRSVGCKGLSDMKLKLTAGSREGIPHIHQSINFGDTAADIMIKVMDNTLAAFLSQRRQDCERTAGLFEQATKAVIDGSEAGHRVEIFGLGTSGIVAQDALRKFSRMGIHASAQTDGIFQTMSATTLRPGDCAIIISTSGRSREMLNIAKVAKGNGATVIAITATDSQLARIANFHLAADHGEDCEFYEPMVSRLMHLLVIDVLVTCVAMSMDYDKLHPMLRDAKHSISNRIYL